MRDIPIGVCNKKDRGTVRKWEKWERPRGKWKWKGRREKKRCGNRNGTVKVYWVLGRIGM
jgi:hypothetical protein